MRFQVITSSEAADDLLNIHEYILTELCSPLNAQNQVRRIADAIRNLDMMPERYERFHAYTGSRNIRIMHIDNYCVIYEVDRTAAVVRISRIVSVRRDRDALIESHAVHEVPEAYSTVSGADSKPEDRPVRKRTISTLKSFEDDESRMETWVKAHDYEGI